MSKKRQITAAFVLGGLLAMGVFAAMTGVTADEVQSNADEHITVSADGEAHAEPDAAVVEVAVEEEHDDPATARNEVAEDANAVRDALEDAGYDVRTSDFTVREQRPFEVPEELEDEPRHVASHEFQVTADDPDDAGDVIDTAMDSGATSVSDVAFTLSDDREEEMKEEALENAMDNARTQAGAIESADDIAVTGVRSVTTDATSVAPVTRSADVYEAELADDVAADTEIEVGDVDVDASVRVVYDAN